MDVSEEKNKQSNRHIFRTHAQLVVAGQKAIVVRTVDIGHNGMSVVAPMNLPHKVTCQIHFTLNLPTNQLKQCDIKAEVTQSLFSSREDGFKVALHFLSVPPEVQKMLAVFLKD